MDDRERAVAWHNLPSEEVAERNGTDPSRGLTAPEAASRLAAHGPNVLPQVAARPAWMRFALQFHTPLVYLLIGSALVTGVLEEWIDAAVNAAVVLANALVGYVQESRATDAIAALTSSVVTHATVIRDGHARRVPSPDLVPGDLVVLAPGDKVPAGPPRPYSWSTPTRRRCSTSSKARGCRPRCGFSSRLAVSWSTWW